MLCMTCECDGKKRHRASFTNIAVGEKISAGMRLPAVDINLNYIAKTWGNCWIHEVMGLDAERSLRCTEIFGN
jgi:hypothetical protein